MVSAPHLPESKNTTKTLENKKIINILISVFFGLFAGATAAIVVAAWIMPRNINTPNGLVFNNNQEVTKVVDALTERRISERVIGVYNKRQVLHNAFNKQQTFIADTVLLSSDGWAAMQVPANYINGQEWSWFGVDRKGTSYTIKNSRYDKFSNILYIQFIGQEFSVASFADWSEIKTNKDYIISNLYNHTTVKISKNSDKQINSNHYIYQDLKLLEISNFNSLNNNSGLLFSQNGSFVGFANKGVITLGYISQQMLPQLLTQNKFKYTSIKVKGREVDSIISDKQVINKKGFLITEVYYPFNRELKIGDVITAINGQPYDPLIAYQQLLSSDDQVQIRVLRNQKEIDITIKKQAI